MDRSEQDEEAESGPPGSSPSRRASRGRDSPSTSPSGWWFDCSISDVQPEFSCHNFRRDGDRNPVHQSLHSRRKNARETFEDEVLRWCERAPKSGSALHYSLEDREEQHSTAPGSRSRSTALTVNVPYFLIHWLQPVNFLLLHGSTTAIQLFGKKFPSEQTLSLSLSTLEPGMCAQSRKCQTGVGLL